MQKREVALQKFIKKWENKKDVIGIIVCGSYITGNPSKHSDIDIHIILSKTAKRRERGNEIINGILIEYFANPIQKHYEYNSKDYKERSRQNAHMLCTGKLLFDNTGEIKKLIKDSKIYLNKKYSKPKKLEIELCKYSIWDTFDNLEELFESKSDDFLFVFHNNLNEFFEIYAQFVGFESVPVHKLKRFLINETDKKKYLVKDFPDQKFVKMFVELIELKEKEEIIKRYKNIINHVLYKMGGFNIDGRKIKSPVI